MPVFIRIKGNKDSDEFKDALELKKFFDDQFKDGKTDGEILIISNATLFGQEVKDIDLIVLGNFENYSITAKTSSEPDDNPEAILSREIKVFINNFCFVIETKRQRAEDVELNGLQLFVRYNNKIRDITTQSEKQKYSLKNYFNDRLNYSPYISNFIWFTNIDWDSIQELLGNNENILTKHNYLPSAFSIHLLFELACVQNHPYIPINRQTKLPQNFAVFNCLFKKDRINLIEMQSIFDLFEKNKKGIGHLTRKKIEQLTSKTLDEQQYALAVGEKFIVISGRAGTGKTMKLIRIAHDLAKLRGERCLIITYNLALVSDIKRLLAFAEIPDAIDNYTINITSLHKFIYELLIGFGIAKNKDNPKTEVKFIEDFIDRYHEYLEELYNYIDNGLIQDKEIQELMISRHDEVAWDFILVDESQDWDDFEKSIIFRIFGRQKVIIADGVDQLIRTTRKCNWLHGLRRNIDYKQTHERRGLRQEVNLVSFVNSYAKQVGISWELEPKRDLIGGKVIISTKGYTADLHSQEIQRCKEYGNSEYEMMFLVPPKLVDRKKNETTRGFKLVKEFEEMGVKIWDGTSKDLRSSYPADLSAHRLLQYDSCRGLEGWTVVCLELDEFIEWKLADYKDIDTGELALETFEQKRDRFVYLWSLIPLTRAIDTLIITINDRNSKIAKSLRKVYEQNQDFVQWID